MHLRRQQHAKNLGMRLGIATLELVLTLPLLLALVVALVWLGYSLVGQMKVTAAARHAAWQERFGDWSGRPFDFNDQNPHEESEKKSVSVTPMLSSESGPESRHVVEKGNWDHRNVAFQAAPNLELMGQMLFAAKTVGVVSEYDDLRDALSTLQRLGDASLRETLAEISRELTGPSEQVDQQGRAAESRSELDRDLDKAKAEGDLRDLREERDRLKQQLKRAEDAPDEEGADDRAWLIEKQVQRVEIEIQLVKDRLDAF